MITEEITDGRFGRPVALAAPAGSVIFMHPITPHASLPNRSDKARRTLIYEYRASDSFAIFYPHMNIAMQPKLRQLRGKPSLYARFGGPAPLITPRSEVSTSLYSLQEKAKASISRQPAAAGMMA
jgi:hypothetical protein